MSVPADVIESPLAKVRAEIARACVEARRDPASVTLVAISKTFGVEAIEPVIAAGQRVFGENRVQEAKAKWPALQGALSRHRAAPRRAAAIEQGEGSGRAVRCHSFGRPAEPRARRWRRRSRKQGRAPTLFVEINTGAEPQKAGVLPEAADAFLKTCRDDYGLVDRGADVHPAGRRATGAAFCAHRQDRAAQWADAAVDGHERGLSDRDRVRCDPCAGRDRDLRREDTNLRSSEPCTRSCDPCRSARAAPAAGGARRRRARRIPPSARDSAGPHGRRPRCPGRRPAGGCCGRSR